MGLDLGAGDPVELGAVDPSAPAPALLYPSEGALASEAVPSGLATRAGVAPREAVVPSAESIGIPRAVSGSLGLRRMPEGVCGMAGEMGEK